MKTIVLRITVGFCVFLLLSAVPSSVSAHPANAPAPTLTGVSPTQAYNYQATIITISGTNFVATPTVRLGNLSLTNVTYMDSTTLTATVPAELPGGPYSLTVTNPDGQGSSLTSAFTVLLSGNGALGSWQATTSMTTTRAGFAAVASEGHIYALGGGDYSGVTLNSVEYAAINPDGSLGTWQATSAMTMPRSDLASVASGGYIYALGGIGGPLPIFNSVERAAIGADGSLGTWETTSPMTVP